MMDSGALGTSSVVRRCALFLPLLLLLLSTTRCRCHQVSFYGDSFLRMSVNHAGAANEVELKFYTSRPDGLLLLAAGTTDFCRIEIRAGMIQARMELGGGPAFVSSPPGVIFSDLRWHHVHLKHSRNSLKMTVDGIYASEVNIPGKFVELNIDNYVFVGGGLTFDDKVFFGNVFDFRGCISDATFNSLDLFQVAKDRGHPPSSDDDSVMVNGVTWSCSPEFGAVSSLPIRFVDSGESFVAFRSLGTRQEATLLFSVRTRSSQAILVFSSGGSSRSDYLALRLIAGQLALHINKGSGTFSMTSLVKVNDGAWHQVELHIDRASARLSVDGQRIQNETLFTDNRFLDLTTHLFIGGVDSRTRREILERSIPTRIISPFRVIASLVGCVAGLRVDGNALGFQEAVRSRSLLPDCQRQFPCQSNPCPPETNCIENDLDSFICSARESLTPSVETVSSSSSSPIGGDTVVDVVRISPLVVKEGDRSPITPMNVRLNVDYSLTQIQDNDIWFRIINSPTHGEIIVPSNGRQGNEPEFSLKDIKDATVFYEHDGSETTTDSLGIEMQIPVSDDSSSSAVFRSKHGFTVPIRVLPVNDRPEIELPENENLILVVNTQLKVTPEILNAVDADDKPSSLEYTVYQQAGADVGYFEILNSNGVRARISKFTQDDINKGRVDYIHRGVHNQRIRIQVSDGRDSSDLKVLKVVAVPLLLNPVVNGGSVVPRSGSIPITRNNLTFSTNAPNQEIEIRYVVTDPPYEGEIQKQQYTDNEWVVVSTFTQKHVDKNRIRYSHYNDSDSRGDYFRFRVSAMDIETQEFEFHVSVIDTRVELVRNRPLILRGTRERPVTWDELKSVSTLPYHGPQDIAYRLKTNPAHGFLYRTYSGGIGDGGSSRKKRLGVGSNLTQADINEGRIVYRLNKALHSLVQDGFEFQVSASGASPVAQRFQVTYEPIVGKLRFTNNGLTDVGEGESAVITAEDLYIEMNGFRDFQYVVNDFPRHGVLRILQPKTNVILAQNASIFSNDDITSNRVQYLHDDSETEEDAFSFTVTSVADQAKRGTPQETVEQSGTFEITVLLKNDNPPQRIVDKVFHVVTGRGRSITPDDLFYHDADVNFDISSLEYTWQTISNGLIVLASNHSVLLFRFTQRDIVDGIVYLQHRDAAYGKSVIWITDGKHISTSLLEIQASDPFVRLENDSSKVVVERGKSIPITRHNIRVVTNVNVAKENVTFHVIQVPSDGTLTVGGRPMNRFTQADLEAEQVRYIHGGSEESSDDDSFRFHVSAVTCHTEGVLHIRVVSAEIPERSLEVVSNRVATVEEMETFTFTGYHLNVSGSNRQPPSQIRFSVAQQPRFGRLLMKTGQMAPQSFTQDDINRELISYEHLDGMEYEDEIVFNVTDGAESLLTNLRFHLKVIPSTIPLEVSNIVVKEGDRVYLSKERIMIPNRYYQSQDVELVLVKGPMHGSVEYQANQGQRRTHFSYAQVRAWGVVYAHDGSEGLQDRFSLVARLRGYPSVQSDPRTIQVTVLPSNDQLPRISMNRPLHVWMGSRTVITKDHLSVKDSDSSAEEIRFIVRTVTTDNGHLALLDKPLTPIFNFTQRQIDDEQIVFVHTGTSESVINFDVTDGLNVLKDNNFTIIAQQLTIALENKAASIEAFPGILQPITTIHLNASTHDLDYPWPINYSLVKAPTKGRLLGLTDSLMELREVNSFTQEEIDNLTVFYNFTASMSTWIENDEFVLSVTSDYATTSDNQTVSVRVAFDNINMDNRNHLTTESAVVVQEGGQIHLSKTHLDATKLKRVLTDSGMKSVDIYYVVLETPRHGVLEVRGKNATRNDRFTQRDINKGYVTYIHDHSESFQDVFSYRLEVDLVAGFEETRKNQLEPKFNGFINITILPVNDQIFHLVTRNPSIELVQGFRFNITRRELLTVDADTSPVDIRYEITIPPKNGLIVKSSDDPTKSITSFTQEDIDENRIQFIQDGSTRSGVFYFQVTDGGFLPLSKAFNIYVHPLRLQLGNSSEVVIIQGDITVTLNATHIPLITNGVRGLVRYNVTRFPSHGHLYLGDLPTTNFTQWDVDREDVFFIQNDIRHSSDSFDLVAYDSHNVLPPRRISVVVRARVKKEEPFKTAVGEPNKITLDHLDASELALTTGSNPTYYVLSQPVFGQLILNSDLSVRRRRESRTPEVTDKSSAEANKSKRKNKNRVSGGGGLPREPSYMRNAVFVFTHDDVVNERVEYRPLPYTITTRKTDPVQYVLHARNAQPATDTLRIIVSPPSSMPSRPIDDEDQMTAVAASASLGAADPFPTGSHPGGTQTSLADSGVLAASSAETSQFHLLVVLLVSGLTVMIIVIVIVTRCYALQKRRRRYKIAAAVAQDAAMFKDLPLSLGNGCYPVAPPNPQQPSDNNLPDDDPTEGVFVFPMRRSRPSDINGGGEGKSKMGVAFAEPVGSDWDNVDPEIVQHCRKSNPLLHEEKVWV